MTNGPDRAGLVVYAKSLDAMSAFYARLLGATVVHADADHHLLQAADAQVLVHAIPPLIAAQVVVTAPPALREDQAFKPFFTVDDLDRAASQAEALGGVVVGPVWHSPGGDLRHVADPEGNIVQLRAARRGFAR